MTERAGAGCRSGDGSDRGGDRAVPGRGTGKSREPFASLRNETGPDGNPFHRITIAHYGAGELVAAGGIRRSRPGRGS